jgi:phospholipase C
MLPGFRVVPAAALLVAANFVGAGAATPIAHVIIIMQENRSFDQYFGTYPGADGFPVGTCVPLDPAKPRRGCVSPFHDVHDINSGGPHGAPNAIADLANGVTIARMDGFVRQQTAGAGGCGDRPKCSGSEAGVLRHDVMGYHNASELPNYWAYAQHFVLQDQLFEGERSWSVPSHLDLVSEWTATCTNPLAASTCRTATTSPKPGRRVTFPWESLFQFLDLHDVSWKYYLGEGTEPDCDDGAMTCAPQNQTSLVPSIWNPAPSFLYVRDQGDAYLATHNPPMELLLADVTEGRLAQLSWVVPQQNFSEHPPAGITAGMEYVTSIVNAVMQSAYWRDTAIFIAWDDWGGFYDHVVPPNVDRTDDGQFVAGFGLRVPGLLVSAWARPGYIDHSVLSLDSYATFIEDNFAGSARLDPAAVGNVEHRPDIRDSVTKVTWFNGATANVGQLIDEFDFSQSPLPPLVLSTHIPTGILTACRARARDTGQPCTRRQVTISWLPVNGPRVPGPFTYHVTRDGMELPQCIGNSTSCVDTPGAGAHMYRAYSEDAAHVSSPASAAAEADEP